LVLIFIFLIPFYRNSCFCDYLSVGANYQNGDYSSKGLFFELSAFRPIEFNNSIGVNPQKRSQILNLIGINYTGSQLRLHDGDDNFIFQHRFSIFTSIGKLFRITEDCGFLPSMGFGIAKYLHYGSIPDEKITNMSNIYPTLPISLELYYKSVSISLRVDYFGNVFRKDQKFSGFRYFLVYNYYLYC